MAIVESPARVKAIMADAVKRAPQYRAEIVMSVVEAFPGFENQIIAATGTVRVPEMAAASGQGFSVAAAPTQAASSKKPAKWSGDIELGGSRATGNTETEQVNAAVKVKYKSAPWETTFKLTYDFASDSGGINTQRLKANADTEYSFTERFFTFGLIEFIDDRFSGFDYELTQAVGIGYRLIKTKDVEFKISAGPGLRISEREDTGVTEFEPVERSNANFAWKISESAKFTNDTTATWGTKRTITENTAAITVKIIEKLSGLLSYYLRNNSKPPPGNKKTDTLTKASLVYTF